MAFNRRGLAHVGAGLWHYRSTDSAAAVTAAGYFTHTPMRRGDHVLRVTLNGAGDVASTGMHVVTQVTNNGATATVATL
jgi:hypothetical protein